MSVPRVELVAVDDDVLVALIHAAIADAAADEVTPPVTAGPSWTPERIEWLANYHRSRRTGLAGATGEATWAVVVDEVGAESVVTGQVRLKRLAAPGEAEIGLWVRRSLRGRGVARAAVRLVLDRARVAGLRTVRAETTPANLGAQRILERNGFALAAGGRCSVDAVLHLPPPRVCMNIHDRA